MDFLKSSKRRSSVSEAVYVLLNIGLAVLVLMLVLAIQSPWPAIGLVMLSKWRVIAVRPRYWSANLQANLVDVIVSLSLVVLMVEATGSLVTQVLLAILYAVWLLLIKPQSNRRFMVIQAGIAVLLGVETLMSVSYGWWLSAVVVTMWVIGFAAARHVFESYDEPHKSFYTLASGFMFAQLGWLFYHWTFAYSIPGSQLQLSQAAIICLALSFVGYMIYDSYYHNQKIRMTDVLLPVLLASSLVTVLLLFFNTLQRGGL